MKVYFSASRLYLEEYKENYETILEVLNKSNLVVIQSMKLQYPKGYFKDNRESNTSHDLYHTMTKNIEDADFCVFEASFPSTVNVGHGISVGLERGKPTVVAYKKGKEPILFRGIKESRIIWVEYEGNDLKDEMEEAICKAKECLDIRFSFFVTPKILAFLNQVSKEKNKPRSVYIRELIEREMNDII